MTFIVFEAQTAADCSVYNPQTSPLRLENLQ